MKIEDKYELLALHKCLMEAKFSADPNDFDIAGSPIAAKLANEVVAELRNIDGEEWDEWREARNHQDRINNLVKALKMQNLNHLSSKQERESFINNAIAPLVASEDVISQIMTEVFGEESI